MTVAIHPDAVQTHAVVSDHRLVLVTAKVGTHDEGHVHAQKLADTLSSEAWSALDPKEQDGWSDRLAAIASKILQGDGQGSLLSFTVVYLDGGHARIWNCGGHRVVVISELGATQAAGDGFADTSNEMLRTIVKEAAGPDVPVPTTVVHQADVHLAANHLLVISPHGQLLSLPDLPKCACVEDVARMVAREIPGLPHALVGVSWVA